MWKIKVGSTININYQQLSEFKISQPLSTISNNLWKIKTGSTININYQQLSEFKIRQPLSTITNNLRKVKTGATIIHYYQKFIFSLIGCTTNQKKQNHTQVLFLYRFFIAHRNHLRTYDRRSDNDISWWCSYKSSVLTVGTFWTCYMHSYFACKGTKNFWLLQIISRNNRVCYIGVQNLYKNDLHPRSPTNQLRYSLDKTPIEQHVFSSSTICRWSKLVNN